MAHARKNYARTDRVKEQMMRDLAQLIAQELKDPDMGFVTLTDVDLSRDYSHATVYYTVLQEDKREQTQQALHRARGFLRSELARLLPIYRTPELNFTFDESIERGLAMDKLLAQTAQEKPVED